MAYVSVHNKCMGFDWIIFGYDIGVKGCNCLLESGDSSINIFLSQFVVIFKSFCFLDSSFQCMVSMARGLILVNTHLCIQQ